MSRLKQLSQERDVKRNEFQSLFQRKRDLQEQVKAVDAEISELQETLFQLDDEIGELEEVGDQVVGGGADALAQHNVSPATVVHPFTQHPDEVLPDLSSTSPDATQAMEEHLTDPLTSTQAVSTNADVGSGPIETDQGDQSDATSPPATAITSFASGRPQLVLQPVNRNIDSASKRIRTIHDFVQKPPPSTATAQTSEQPGVNGPFSTQQILQTLQSTFRIPSFRATQQAIIQATLSGKDCFVIMRTGGGKSLLYQLPAALERPKVTLVISPLLSLMEDQQDQMNAFCPRSCVSFHSGLTTTQQSANWERVRDPSQNVGMILVTPERVYKSNRLKSELQRLHSAGRFARIVIDECHCCCQWGHDFRPDYAKMGVLRSTFSDVPILAVTATASERVREDCARILQMQSNYQFFQSTANRPNLTYSIERKEGSALDTLDDIAHFIQTKHPRSAGIIYTFTKKDADTVATQLVHRGITAAAYHSNVTSTKKTKIHKSWMQNKTQVVVATIAFGLGINKPDVRFVLHHCISKTLEAYYQESGRAGRDGNPADCVLYYSPKDVPRMIRMVHGEQSEALVWTVIKYAQQFGSDAVCRAIQLHNLGEPMDMQAALQADDAATPPRDVLSHAQTVLQLLYTLEDDKMTLPKLVKAWRSNPNNAPECVKNNPPGKELSTFACEYIVVSLMVQKLITCNVKYTAYDAVVYLKFTPKAEQFLTSPRAHMTIRLPEKKAKTKAAPPQNGRSDWIEPNGKNVKKKRSTTATKRKRSSSVSSAAKKKDTSTKRPSSKTPATKKTAKKSSASTTRRKSAPEKKSPPITATGSRRKSTASLPTEVIDIDDGDSSIDEDDMDLLTFSKQVSSSVARARPVDELMDDTDEEYEFDE